MFTSSSNFTNDVDALFVYITALSLIVLIGITVAMIYFVIRYSRKRNPVPKNIEGNLTLEILWTGIPLLLFISMFYFGWVGYKDMRAIPDDALQIKVTARMWQWSFEYPNGLKTDTLYVPVSKPVRVDLHSMDVNHAFFIPAFRVKKDVYPNKKNDAWFQSEKVGRYDIACAEYCGLNHSYMYSAVHIMEQKAFDQWFADASKKANLEPKLVAQTK
ncbi:MAG: cytochrome c oxidase subunit II [Ignavibacteriales bacterium]|nr:cytochrome c oxidase subunit II [Ignavibacteriales bacterium]